MKAFVLACVFTATMVAGYCLYRRARIQSGIQVIESMGGAVSVHESSLGGPTRVTLKLEGVESMAHDERILSNSSALRGLWDVRRLKAGRSPLGDKGLRVLLDCWSGSLKHIDISNSNVTPDGVKAAVVACPGLVELIISPDQTDERVEIAVDNRRRLNLILEKSGTTGSVGSGDGDG